jgi:putative transposase
MRLLTYEYRLYPRQCQQTGLDRLLDQAREVYNTAVQQCRNAYAATSKHQTALSQWPYFRDWRNAFDDVKLNASSVQHILRRVDKAYAAFFRRLKAKATPGHPRFKGKERFNSLDYTYGDGCKLDYDGAYDRIGLRIQNVGEVKVKLHRCVPANATIKHVVIKRRASGWYVCLMLELPEVVTAPNTKPPVGIDLGLLRLLTLSDATEFDNPRWLRGALADVRVAQRRLARRKPGSSGRKAARQLVAKRHEHVANVRRDFWHKVTYQLVHTYGLIALEQLALAFMTRNAHLALSAHDAALGAFQTTLGYKAANAGSQVVLVNPAFTSQACSGCGVLVEKALSVRVHSCPACGLKLDRDHNAALNILKRALNSARTEPSGANVDTRSCVA